MTISNHTNGLVLKFQSQFQEILVTATHSYLDLEFSNTPKETLAYLQVTTRTSSSLITKVKQHWGQIAGDL